MTHQCRRVGAPGVRLWDLFSVEQLAQCFRASCREYWQVNLNDIPKPVFPDLVVLVPQTVSESPYFPPRLARYANGGEIA